MIMVWGGLFFLFAYLVFLWEKILWLRQIPYTIDAKIFHKLLTGAVEYGPANAFCLSFDGDEFFFQKFLNGVITVDAPDLLHLTLGDRLFVGYDG